jgi:hypothetical protein
MTVVSMIALITENTVTSLVPCWPFYSADVHDDFDLISVASLTVLMTVMSVVSLVALKP